MRVEQNKLSPLKLLVASLALGLAVNAGAAPVDANAPQFAATSGLFPALASNDDDCGDEIADNNVPLRAMSMSMGSAAAPAPASNSLAGLDSQFGNRVPARGASSTSVAEQESSSSRSRTQSSASLGGSSSTSGKSAAVKESRSNAMAETSSWVIQSTDKTLNGALTRWATAAGWQLVWDLPVDYPVQTRTVLPGTFEEAVGAVARSMEGAEVPMKAVFYRGNKVLRVMAKNS